VCHVVTQLHVLSCRLSITILSTLLIPSKTLQRPITRTISRQTKQPLTSLLDFTFKSAKPREVYDRVPMASHRYSRYATSNSHAYSQTEESASNQRRHYSRYTDSEEPAPRRRRWAAGYIDSRSCPSYDYIDRRRKSSDDEDEESSDIDYIHPQTNRNNESIESQKHRGSGTSRSSARYERERERSPPQQQLVRASERLRESEIEEHSGSDVDETYTRYRIHAPQKPITSSDPEIVEGSDILTTSLELDSDIVSIRSGRSSTSVSGRAASEASYVKLRRRGGASSDSESDEDGDYISLDEYIAGRSDCNSVRVVSGDEGEGSDAVGSDVEVRSDAGEGSDVASVEDCGGYDSEDDCIGERCVGYYGIYARR
jgi:hypothetical protein